jgi:hypothetical protein
MNKKQVLGYNYLGGGLRDEHDEQLARDLVTKRWGGGGGGGTLVASLLPLPLSPLQTHVIIRGL